MSNWFGDIGKSLTHPFDLNKGWTAFQHIDPALTNIVPGLMSTEDKALSKTWGALGVDDLSNMFGKDSDNAGRGLRHRAGAALAYLAGSYAAGGSGAGSSGESSGLMNTISNYWDKARYNVGDLLENGKSYLGDENGASGTNWNQLLSKGLNQMGKMGQQQGGQSNQGTQGGQGMQIDPNTGWYVPAPTQFNPNQNNYSPQQLAALLRQG